MTSKARRLLVQDLGTQRSTDTVMKFRADSGKRKMKLVDEKEDEKAEGEDEEAG